MTLIEKRRRKPFRVFAGSPSWLHEEQIVTPREWNAPLTSSQSLAKQIAWFLCKVVIATAVVIALVGAVLAL